MMQYEELGTASLRSVFAACYFVSEKNTFYLLILQCNSYRIVLSAVWVVALSKCKWYELDTDDMRVDIYEPRFVLSRGAYVIYF